MLNVKKRSFIVIMSILILVGVVVIAGIVALRPTPVVRSNVPANTPSHVVKIDITLAHTYTSLKELKKDSTLIVLGNVQTQQTFIGAHGVPYTISTFNVERTVMSKSTPSQTVHVRQAGGVTPDGTKWYSEEFPLLQIGSRYILFLTPSPDPAVLYPVGAPQGVFTVSASNAVNSFSEVGVLVNNVAFDTFVKDIQSA